MTIIGGGGGGGGDGDGDGDHLCVYFHFQRLNCSCIFDIVMHYRSISG